MSAAVYLDYAATTPVDPRVAERMSHYLTLDGVFGNPGSRSHRFGLAAGQAVDQARDRVAALIGAEPREIVWTSGATESNNLALKGAVHACQRQHPHIVTCKSEHKAVLDVCHQLERAGCRVTYLDPRGDGLIDLDQLAAALDDDTLLVSIMHVNNETGVRQDLVAIGRLTRGRGILLHVDAAQSAGKTPIDVEAMNIDLLSVCAHKVYGPKGIGALYVRRRPRVRLEPLLHGGGQERGLRAGTLATHQIVGLGDAFRLAGELLEADTARLQQLRNRLLDRLLTLSAVRLNGHSEHCVPGIVNLGFQGIDAEALLLGLDDIALSTGSACGSANQEVSHVLRAIGLDHLTAAGSVRLSLGRFTTEAEIDYAAERIVAEVARLRALSPLWTDRAEMDRPVSA